MSASDPSSSSSAVIPWGKSTRSSPRLRERQLVFQVLDNPSLREEILKHAIIGRDNKVDQRSACNLRRVDKSWNESVLRILWNAHKPLYWVRPEAGGDLDAFTKAFAVYSTISGPPPPLNLERYSSLYRVSDIDIFSTFLATCGPALVQLGFTIHDFGHPLPVKLPFWSLPRLHKLDITVALRPRSYFTAGEQPEAELAAPHANIPEGLMKPIFLGATALAELSLDVSEWARLDPAGADVSIFDSITFPPSLVKIKLDMDLDLLQSKDFVKSLLKCHLPKVTSFSVTVRNRNDAFADGLLFLFMDKWKTGLKHLVISGISYGVYPRNASDIRFPVMEQLEEVSISSTSVQLETGLRSLESCFPKLRTMRLRRQTLDMLRKWTESSRFSGVTSLELVLADEHVRGNMAGNFLLMSVNVEAMQLVNAAFPNLRKLELGISSSDPRGLWYVFQEMKQLVALKLKVLGNLYERTTDVWDSILTGVPPERMASIRGRGPGSHGDGAVFVPVTNLQDLKSFSVKYAGASLPRSVISDFILEHAFLRMPQLTHLHFEGPFRVSATMIAKWMSEGGRSLIYQAR